MKGKHVQDISMKIYNATTMLIEEEKVSSLIIHNYSQQEECNLKDECYS